jgi:hypothetical protein
VEYKTFHIGDGEKTCWKTKLFSYLPFLSTTEIQGQEVVYLFPSSNIKVDENKNGEKIPEKKRPGKVLLHLIREDPVGHSLALYDFRP